MKIIKLSYYWKDELKDILLEQGFDKVLERIEEMLKEQNLIIDNERR